MWRKIVDTLVLPLAFVAVAMVLSLIVAKRVARDEERIAHFASLTEEKTLILGFVMASKGYPGDYEKGYEITIPEDINARVYHMGTSVKDGKYYTAGGRVLMVVGFGENLQDAHDKALAAVESIKCDNLFYRRDIGWRVL